MNRTPALILVLPLAALLACGKRDAPQLRAEAVTRGPISEVVSATGGVEAIVTVNVGSQVSGTVSELKVDFNSQVKKGQLLARIDPRPFDAALAKARASVASADANVVKSRAAFNDAQRIEKRQKELFGRGLISQADVDTAAANREQAEAQLAAARAQVQQARADQQQAALNLEFTRIISPVDGIVISRSIDLGQTVAAAFQAPQLFVIAGDLTQMRVLANIDEADVGKVKEGQDVKFTVDSYPGEEFNGTIKQVRQAPSTVNNVVTYAAEVTAPNPEHKLRQGMTAAVQVITAKRANALRVANAALRWKPDDAAAAAPQQQPRSPGGAQAQEGGPGPGRPSAAQGQGQGQGQSQATPRGSAGDAKTGEARNEVLDRPVGVEGQQNPADRRASGQRKQRTTRVFKLQAGKPVAVNIRVGVSDGRVTEVLDGLNEGDEIIVGGAGSVGGAGPQRGGGPRRGLF